MTPMVERMKELLEAERAGVRCLLAMAEETKDGNKKDFFMKLCYDEGRFCSGLARFIEARGGVPGDRIGPFADKVLSLGEEVERLSLLVKGQAWVVRKIDEIPREGMTPEEAEFFADMRETHVVNIEECRTYLLPAP